MRAAARRCRGRSPARCAPARAARSAGLRGSRPRRAAPATPGRRPCRSTCAAAPAPPAGAPPRSADRAASACCRTRAAAGCSTRTWSFSRSSLPLICRRAASTRICRSCATSGSFSAASRRSSSACTFRTASRWRCRWPGAKSEIRSSRPVMPCRAANSGENWAWTWRRSCAFWLLRSIQPRSAVLAAETGGGGGCGCEQETASRRRAASGVRMRRAVYPSGPRLQRRSAPSALARPCDEDSPGSFTTTTRSSIAARVARGGKRQEDRGAARAARALGQAHVRSHAHARFDLANELFRQTDARWRMAPPVAPGGGFGLAYAR